MVFEKYHNIQNFLTTNKSWVYVLCPELIPNIKICSCTAFEVRLILVLIH
jgi:hypothetical protein